MNELFFTVFIVNLIKFGFADEVVGCGGFLKSHVPIDFSKVEVKLITKQGIIKDRTTAAPNNGYYFVPLYDKGEMLLELSPPPGWSFEPKKVVLHVDGVNDLCSKGVDINFVFEGFGITGRVESLGSNKGPSGVTVELQLKNDTRSTITDQEGNFFFTPVFPGTYTVSISHPKWKMYKKLIDVEVAESNKELPSKSLMVQGYEVSGMIKSDGEPVKDTIVILFSEYRNMQEFIDGCDKEKLSSFNIKSDFLCYTTTNSDGQFIFKTVPNGEYHITAYFKSQNIYFHPQTIKFTVNHDDIQLPENFEIIGFNVPGRVLRSKNIPIPNAKVFVNGQQVTKTDSKGLYKLEKMKAGTYKLRAEASDLIFEESIVRLSPSLEELPDLLPSAFKVCGAVTSDSSQIVTFTKLGSSNFIQTETSPADGGFCQYLSSGHYEVKVVVNEEDKQKGLQFFPLTQVIEVTSEKKTNVIFSQLKTDIVGEVKCIKAQDCEGLIVVLKPENTKEIMLKVTGGLYSVNDMYPGTYKIRLLADKFCWETTEQTLTVNTAKAEVPQFIQNGYAVNFVFSHDAKVHYKHVTDSKSNVFEVAKGRSTFCLKKPGEYTFTIESCHSYNENTLTYRTDSEVNQVLLNALKHTSRLSIQAESDFGDLKVSVKIGIDKVEKTLKYKNGQYDLDIILEPGDNAVVVPQSSTLFFTPPILLIVGVDDCKDQGIQFVAVKGKLFEGKIIPPLQGVTVTVESSDDAETLVVETDNEGFFKFHPLDNKKEYKIHATKESYVLTGPDADGNFLAHKLAEVILEVVDGFDNIPLQGVLLSLSGGESYRKNLQTNENGKVSFTSLSPGEYFLRPMMKEYVFEPNSKIIPVNEGEIVNVRLVGKRVAYSAFGQVVSLNDEPEDNMVIVASGLNNCTQYSEETTCESNGQFRIRGLQPYCSYKVEVKGTLNENNIIERSAPEFIQIDAIKEDLKGLKFIVFRPVTQTDLLVKIYSENIDYYKSLKVKLLRELGTPFLIHTIKVDWLAAKLTKSINPGLMVHFPSIPLDNESYSLQLESGLVQNMKLPSHNFNANSSFKYFEMDFKLKSNIVEHNIKQTSIWSLLFIFIILVFVYNIEIIANLLKEKFNFNISGLTNLIPVQISNQKNGNDYYDDADIDQIVQSINNTKKKPKPKLLKLVKK